MVNSLDFTKDLFCEDLPTKPLSGIGRILVTGASGYVGGRLVPELLARRYRVRVMVRGRLSEYRGLWPEAEVVEADALSLEQLKPALAGVEVAYYLIHSLHLGPKGFAHSDIQAAEKFAHAADSAMVKRIIYLGGLGDIRNPLSSHLRTRMEVAEKLSSGRAQVTMLRAAIIVGSGSASFEIIEHLTKRLPILPVPLWAKNRCQPIGIRDVIKYLVGVLEVPETAGKSFDIGGKDILTYEEILKSLSAILDKKILFIPFPFFGIGTWAYFTSLLTPVPNPITRCLIEGLTSEVVCQNDSIKSLLPFEPLSCREAFVRAMSREEQDRISTRWSDAYPPAHEFAIKLNELGQTRYTACHSLLTRKEAGKLFRSICGIGGREGWFHSNWMWRTRGMLDKLLLGVGSSRGRKSHSRLQINDVIDFWRVEDLVHDRKLLLRAEMKLPGKAWLEFTIEDDGSMRKLSVIAHYETHTLPGALYWYLFLPFHHFIFVHLIESIEQRS